MRSPLDDEITFQPRVRKQRKPRGVRSVAELVLSPSEAEALDHEVQFRDPSIQELHDQGLVDQLLQEIRGGKEATVYLGRRAGRLVAVKLYRDAESRSFRNDRIYREHRAVKERRARKAMATGSRAGRWLRQDHWVEQEYTNLCRLHSRGIAVPRPWGRCGRAIVMELLGDRRGVAPTLAQARLSFEQAHRAFDQAVEILLAFRDADFVHGDFSTHNLVWWRGSTYAIDLPQGVSYRGHGQAGVLLTRDVRSLCASFLRLGLEVAEGTVWDRLDR